MISACKYCQTTHQAVVWGWSPWPVLKVLSGIPHGPFLQQLHAPQCSPAQLAVGSDALPHHISSLLISKHIQLRLMKWPRRVRQRVSNPSTHANTSPCWNFQAAGTLPTAMLRGDAPREGQVMQKQDGSSGTHSIRGCFKRTSLQQQQKLYKRLE